MPITSCGCGRRAFLAGLGLGGAAALLPGAGALAQGASAPARSRLDLHHHFGSPRWIKRILEIKRQGFYGFENYSVERDLEAMDKAGIQTAYLSCTEPGIWYGDDFRIERAEAISMARDMNDYGARMVADHKGRYGLFAVLPLPDVDASLKEIAYAFDVLKADGVGILTSYGDMWLGDKRLEPVMDELNRRGAVVYVHPTDATCCHNNLGGLSVATLEWFTDTARTIGSLITRRPGTPASVPASEAIPAARYSNIKFIFSHGGGTLVSATRIVGTVSEAELSSTPAPNTPLYFVRRFFYDTAGAANPLVMQGLKKLMGGTSHIVFGTDYPYYVPSTLVDAMRTVGFSEAELRGIDRDNALAFLPKRA